MLRLLLPGLALALASCELTPSPADTAPAAPRNGVEIADRWILEGAALDYEMTKEGGQVLRAAAQNGARLYSTVPPLHTRVSTIVEADEIYYNAFLRRFDFFGNITLQQGQVIERATPVTKWSMHEDGDLDRNPDRIGDDGGAATVVTDGTDLK